MQRKSPDFHRGFQVDRFGIRFGENRRAQMTKVKGSNVNPSDQAPSTNLRRQPRGGIRPKCGSTSDRSSATCSPSRTDTEQWSGH